MQRSRHEIPTHLNVEDKALYGLSVRQVMYLTSGFSLGYGLWNSADALPVVPRAIIVACCALVAVLFALVRPGGRGLEEWLFVVLRYAAVPRVSIWQPREPDSDRQNGQEGAWAELAPGLWWGEEVS